MLRKHSISAGLANVLGLVSNIICFHSVESEPIQLFSSCSKNPIFAVDERSTENVRLLLLLSFADNSKIEDLKNALVNLSMLELGLLHTRTWDFAFHTHQVFGILPVNHSN